MYSANVYINQIMQRESDDSNHYDVESITEPTEHVEHYIDSDNSDDCLNLRTA